MSEAVTVPISSLRRAAPLVSRSEMMFQTDKSVFTL
jgi:hypothetical protein